MSRFAVTTMLLLAGCGSHAASPPASAVPTQAARPRGPAPAPEPVCRCMRVCIVERGELVDIPVRYNVLTGDTLSEDGLPFTSVAPLTGEYASVAEWYVRGRPIRFNGRTYEKYGRPRILGINEVRRIGRHEGVGIYGEPRDSASAAPDAIYVPTRPGCDFQPYVVPDSVDRANASRSGG